MTVTLEDIKNLVGNITRLGKQLPDSVPKGTQQDMLYNVMKDVNKGNLWETFNC